MSNYDANFLEQETLNLFFMPIVRVLMYPGRTQQQKDDLAKAITDAVERIAKAPRDQTIVVIQEVPKEQYYVAANRAA
jgi:4-oxalocrotonate tautomerase